MFWHYSFSLPLLPPAHPIIIIIIIVIIIIIIIFVPGCEQSRANPESKITSRPRIFIIADNYKSFLWKRNPLFQFCIQEEKLVLLSIEKKCMRTVLLRYSYNHTYVYIKDK